MKVPGWVKKFFKWGVKHGLEELEKEMEAKRTADAITRRDEQGPLGRFGS